MLSSDRRKIERGWVVVPFIDSATAQEAEAAVRAAGLTGPITIKVLSEDDAILETPEGRVTGCYPRWDEIVAPTSGIEIFVNPGQPAPLTVQQRSERDAFRRRDERDRDLPASIFKERPKAVPNFAADRRPAAFTTLTADLLSELEQRLRDGGAGVVDALNPGLTDAQIDELLLPAGIDLPDEARVWWRWQNGTRRGARAATLGLRDLLDLETVVDVYEHARFRDVRGRGLDGLLGGLGWTPRLWFDCSGARHERVPVFAQSDIEDPRVVLGSMGDLVTAWLHLIDAGVWRIDADGSMDVDYERAPEHLFLIA